MKRFLSLLMAAVLVVTIGTTSAYADKQEVDDIIASIPADWPAEPTVSAEGAILLDADSGEILYAKNATEAMYPASTTKLMTALLTLENGSLEDIVDFPFEATNIPADSSHIGMRRGEQMVLRECLYGLLLPSANEVANALAIHIGGSLQSFVYMMNKKSEALGCVNTNFANVNGLHDENHYTCAYDLALIMQACSKNSVFVEIASTQSYVHHADALLNKDIPMTNTDKMIRTSSEYYNENVVCGKTGHTEEAGYNLVSYAEKDGVRLVAVVLGCEDGNQYVSTQSLLDYGFNYFTRVLPAELDSSISMEKAYTDSPLQIPVEQKSLLSLKTTESILVPVEVTFDMLEKSVDTADGSFSITYSYQGYPLGSVALAGEAENENSGLFLAKDAGETEKAEVSELIVIDGWLVVLAVVLILVVLGITRNLYVYRFPTKRTRK